MRSVAHQERLNNPARQRASADHPSGARVHLEVLGFWTPDRLRGRLADFAHAGVARFILAAWDELRGSREPLAPVPRNVLTFKTSLDPAVVALKAEELCGAA